MSVIQQTEISILGNQVPATLSDERIDKLRFLPDNPRVYAVIRGITKFNQLAEEEQQEKIYHQLTKERSFKNLMPEVEKDGGLQEPILVRRDTDQVIEGNTRLAVYRRLHELKPYDERWQRIRCLVISKLNSDQQLRVLGQMHLQGKTDWTSYAKALWCYRLICEEGYQPSQISELSSLSVRAINKNVQIVKMMQENKDDKEAHYSYYDVALGNRKISNAIKDDANGNLRDTVLSGIRHEEFTAQQLRDWLPVVLGKPKVTKKFASGNITLKDAHDRSEVSDTKKRFDKIYGLLDAIEAKEIDKLDFAEIRAVKQIALKVEKKATRLRKMVDRRQADTRR